MFKPLIRISVLSCLISLNAYAAPPTDPVVVINGTTLTQQDYDQYLEIRGKKTKTNVTPDKQTIIQEMIDRELLRQDALNKKLDQDAKFIEQLKQVRDNLLMSTALQTHLEANKITDAVVRNFYNQRISQIQMPKEYKARHILVETEAEAKDIIAEIEKGKSFGELAKAKSTDIGSAKNNGDLGWATKQKYVPAFGNAMVKLAKGEYTKTPVKSRFGWHILQVVDIRTQQPPAFNQVKEQIRNALQSQQMQQYSNQLRAKAKIKIIK
jgi:peptidyl-prolyl cis-trans isomerase C